MAEGEGRAARSARIRIKKERESLNWTLDQMAEKLRSQGIQQARPTTVHKMENGSRRISIDELAAFAQIFKIGIADLIMDQRAYIQDLYRRYTDAMESYTREMERLTQLCAEADAVLGGHELLVLADESITHASDAFDALTERFMAAVQSQDNPGSQI